MRATRWRHEQRCISAEGSVLVACLIPLDARARVELAAPALEERIAVLLALRRLVRHALLQVLALHLHAHTCVKASLSTPA